MWNILRGICGAFSSGIQEMRKWLCLGLLHRKNQVTWLLAGGQDGQWMHQTHEHGKWASFPRIILMQFTRKRSVAHWCESIRVETPRLSGYASHTNGHAVHCEIHRVGWDNCWRRTLGLCFNCFRGPGWDWQWKPQTDGNRIRPFFPHIIPMPSTHKGIFVAVMSTVLKPQIICLQFPPTWHCHKVWNILSSSCSAHSWGIWEWEHNSDCALYWLGQCTALKNGRDPKAVLGRAVTHQQPENIMPPISPHIIPVPVAPKKVLVCVTSRELKHPAFLAKLAGPQKSLCLNARHILHGSCSAFSSVI